MKNVLFALISIFILASCSNDVSTDVDSGSIDSTYGDTSSTSCAVYDTVYVPDYSNPAIIDGSSFGEFFRVMKMVGDYDGMLAFTSKDTREKFGDEALWYFYQEMDFGYEITLNAMTNCDSVTTLLYTGEIMATKKFVRMNVVVENDSTKLVLDKLDYKNPF